MLDDAAGAVRERPALFSAPMVRAILADQKTVTRRVMKPQPEAPRCIYDCDGADTVVTPIYRESTLGTVTQFSWAMTRLNQTAAPFVDTPMDGWRCPFGGPGDRLWVRETWSPDHRHVYPCPTTVYRADGYVDEPIECRCSFDQRRSGQTCAECLKCAGFKWRPSIFMPRNRSRLSLRVTGVRVERLHDITPEEVLREGVRVPCDASGTPIVRLTGKHPPSDFLAPGWAERGDVGELLLAEWASLWSQINGRASYDANPWTWAVSFEREK